MVLSPLKRMVLTDLRYGPLDHHQVAADLTQAPWLMRIELQALERHDYVASGLDERGRCWRLTEKGRRVVTADDQLAFPVTA